jgi:hypothetical protein
MPKRKSEKRQLHIKVGLSCILPPFGLTKIRRLHKVVNAQPTGKAFFIIDYELPVLWLTFLEWPSIQAGVNERHGTGKVHQRTDAKR